MIKIHLELRDEVFEIRFQIKKIKKLKIKIFKIKRYILVIFFFECYFCDKNLKKNYLRELTDILLIYRVISL